MNSKYYEKPFFIGLLLIVSALVVFIFLPYLDAIVLAITLAVIFHPLYLTLKKVMSKWEGLSAFITVVIALIIIITPLIFFGFHIFQEARGVYIDLSSGYGGPFIAFLHGQLYKLAPGANISISQYAQQAVGILIGSIGSIFSKLAGIAVTLLLSMFTFYYLLKDAPKLRSAIIRISPLPSGDANKIISKLSSMANSIIKGSLMVGVLQGIIVGFGFLIFGLPNPVLWGSVSIIAAFVPIIGISFVVIPGMLSLFLLGNIVSAIDFGIFAFLLAGLVDNFLRPYLIGRNEKVHPLLVLFSVIGGLTVFGPMGFLLGPLALSLFLTLIEIYPTLILERGSD